MERRIVQAFVFLVSALMFAQRPTHSTGPNNNDPIDLSNWVDILIYIVFPVVIILVYILWRRMVRKEKMQEKEEK